MNDDDLEPIDLAQQPQTGVAGARKRFQFSRRHAALLGVGVVVLAAGVGVVAHTEARHTRRTAGSAAVSSSTGPGVVEPPGDQSEPRLQVGPPTKVAIPAINMISAFGSLWVSQPDRVARLDPVTARVTATISVPGTSDFRNLAAGAGALWVGDTGTATVTRIDPTRDRVTASISMRGSAFVPDGLAFRANRLWVVRPMPTSRRGDIVAIDPATNRIVHQTSVPRTFDVIAGSTALWYVAGTDLQRFDIRSLHTTVARRDVRAVLTAANGHLWLLTSTGVIETDERTGAQIGAPIPLGDVANTTAAVGSGVLWLGWQPDSSSAGTVRPYDTATHRGLAAPITVGFPIVAMTVLDGAVWVDADGLTRIPFSSPVLVNNPDALRGWPVRLLLAGANALMYFDPSRPPPNQLQLIATGPDVLVASHNSALVEVSGPRRNLVFFPAGKPQFVDVSNYEAVFSGAHGEWWGEAGMLTEIRTGRKYRLPPEFQAFAAVEGAFLATRHDRGDIVIVDPIAGTSRELVSVPATPVAVDLTHLAWIPSHCRPRACREAIRVTNLQTGRTTLLRLPKPFWAALEHGHGTPQGRFSPDGSRLAIVSLTEPVAGDLGKLAVLDVRTGALQRQIDTWAPAIGRRAGLSFDWTDNNELLVITFRDAPVLELIGTRDKIAEVVLTAHTTLVALSNNP